MSSRSTPLDSKRIASAVVTCSQKCSKPSQPECCCCWSDCTSISDAIQASAPEGHPWKGPPFQIKYSCDSLKKQAIIHNIRHHLKVPKSIGDPKKKFSLFVVQHHWLEVVHMNCSYPSTWITEMDALSFDKACGLEQSHKQHINKIEMILDSLGISKPTEMSDHEWILARMKYIQAPIMPREKVIDIVDVLTGTKKQRTNPKAAYLYSSPHKNIPLEHAELFKDGQPLESQHSESLPLPQKDTTHETDMNPQSVMHLDRYNMMDVSLMTRPFTFKSVNFMVTDLAKQLGCFNQMRESVDHFTPYEQDLK